MMKMFQQFAFSVKSQTICLKMKICVFLNVHQVIKFEGMNGIAQKR